MRITQATVSTQSTAPSTILMQRFSWISLLVSCLVVRSSGFLFPSFGELHQVGFDMLGANWGAYTPYYPVEQYQLPPSDCTITQVNIIQRHGARFPTRGSTIRILVAVNKLLSAGSYNDPVLYFLRNYTYRLGVDDLLPLGALQSQFAGWMTYERYTNLISDDNLPFVRASSRERVVDSARNWTLGISLASNRRYSPTLSIILDENSNNTLSDHLCPKAGTSYKQTGTWALIFGAPIAKRLNAQAPGAALTALDVPSLMSLCALESASKDAQSQFCDLFSPAEFSQYEYYSDLEKYYIRGYGQKLGPVQGVGYINELLARLTQSPVRDNTQTNRTLDASPITFPLDRTVYADFSHDNEMIAIYAALGLFKQQQHLDPTRFEPERTWITSRLTPFSGRMVTERLNCSGARSGGSDPKTYVRILVNDAIQPLEFCGGDRNGLCELESFTRSQRYARNDGEGDFEKCFN